MTAESMRISESIRRLATFTERLEAPETEITEFETRNAYSASEDALEADFTVEVPLLGEGARTSDVELDVTDASIAETGTLSIRLTACIDRYERARRAPDERATPANELTDGGSTVASECEAAPLKRRLADDAERSDRPTYKDPERLAAVYDFEKSFPEMRDNWAWT